MIAVACGTREQAKQSDTADFSLYSIDGKEYTLSEFKGQVVIIDFWATWCPPCRNSIPAFIRLYNKYHERGFTILGIGLDNDDQALRDFSKQMNIPYPVLIGDNEIAKAYQVSGIPKTIFLDKKGSIRKTQVGFAPELEAQFDQLVDSLLNE
jgi:thiol-disulfide isomerase/thioredoxin